MTDATSTLLSAAAILKCLSQADSVATERARQQGLDAFVSLLLAAADAQSLEAIGAGPIAAEAKAGFEALVARQRGKHRVAMRPSAIVTDGNALEILNDDMPFLLDSVLAEVQARGHDVHLVLHPTFKAIRDAEGSLLDIAGPGDGRWGDGRQESYIVLHLGPLNQPRQAELTAAISGILDEVRLAVAGWRPMLARLGRAIADLSEAAVQVAPEVLDEHLAFLAWLAEGHFTFLGVREYRLDGTPEAGELVTRDGDGLGLLTDPTVHVLRRGTELAAMTPEIRQFFFSTAPVIITKANVVARVHRRVHMDYIGIKQYAADGSVRGELRIVGLFTSSAYTQSPRQIPVLRQKVAAVQEQLGLAPESHAAKALLNTLEAFPRDELFQIGTEDLKYWTAGILDLDLRPRVRVFLRTDHFDRFVSALVFVPRDRFTTSVRERIGEHLADRFGGYIAAFYPHFGDGPLVRVHFIVARRTGRIPVVASSALEDGIRRIVRTWTDGLREAISGLPGDTTPIAARYLQAFPIGYTEAYSPARALEDIARIERLSPERPLAIDFHGDAGTVGGRVHVAIYCLDQPIPLSERVPLLEYLGFTVVDERTWRLAPKIDSRSRVVVLHDMLLETFDRKPLEKGHGLDLRLEDSFLAVTQRAAESDAFNRLVMIAGLDWREAAVLRSYALYMRQLRSTFGPRYIAETLCANRTVVADLMALFHLRFDPNRDLSVTERQAASEPILSRIEATLASVQNLDEDRILREVLALVLATVRTNFYQPLPDGRWPETIAFKFDGALLVMAPAPRPYREIFVASPRVEGVHLRFAPIARGGIRWSDRAQDYRTEVLGLARAQQVKNAVIVPAGAKGGFLPKALPRNASRDEIQTEAMAAYTVFVGAMLDLSDNIVDGAIVPPIAVVRHDGDDAYLVVAADKGTATFSDTANAIAQAHNFWLGDAFASGGSAGYDHKGMGITARGAWECVKRHFREMDKDIQSEGFSVVGVGDMSGDVFGNAMLLSPATKLVAAFDHRDIFLDPNPDPASSLAERRRLFATSRSSWADYDRGKLSKGGGVFSRQAKSIALSPEVRELLGLAGTALAPADLIRAILAAPVDLLWFGGIGTYVRAAGETDADVGDRSNDPVRVTAGDLRCRVIGEGANLGVTQAGRIEAATRGVRLNTDFIDNSAGVNTSDQEVNIKIALAPAVRSGRLALEERNRLLAAMTGDVAAAVLRNNYQQSLALSLAERRQTSDVGAIGRLLRDLELRGIVDRRREALPRDHEISERMRTGRGLSRPELALVLAYAKIALLHDLLASNVSDDPYLAGLLTGYFPAAIREAHRGDILGHPLRREIVATTLTNGLVNRLGPATPLALADAAGRPVAEVAFAFVAARETLGLTEIWLRVDALDGQANGAAQLDLYEHIRQSLVATTARFLGDGIATRPVQATLDIQTATARQIAADIWGLAPAGRRQQLEEKAAHFSAGGIPANLAHDVATLAVLSDTPTICAIADQAGTSVATATAAHLAMSAFLGLDGIAAKSQTLSPTDNYERLAIGGGLASLDQSQRRIGIMFIRSGGTLSDLPLWLSRFGPVAERARQELVDIAGDGEMSVARLTVAAARLAALAQAATR